MATRLPAPKRTPTSRTKKKPGAAARKPERQKARPADGDVGAQIEAWIAEAPAWAQPICRKVRRAVRRADPRISESWKWGGPVFEKDGLVCGLGAFKQHVAVHFFKGALMADPAGILERCPGTQTSRRVYLREGDRIGEVLLCDYVAEAVRLNERGVTTPKKPVTVDVPEELSAALRKDEKARRYFDGLTPSHRREYASHVGEAKRAETRERRTAKVMAMLREGTTLYAKYR